MSPETGKFAIDFANALVKVRDAASEGTGVTLTEDETAAMLQAVKFLLPTERR